MDFSFGAGFGNGSIFNADPSGSGGTPPAPHISGDSQSGSWFDNLINNAQKAYTAYENAQAVNDYNKLRAQAGLYPVTGTQYFSGNGSALGGVNLGSLMILLVVVVVIVAVIGAVSHR